MSGHRVDVHSIQHTQRGGQLVKLQHIGIEYCFVGGVQFRWNDLQITCILRYTPARN